MARSRSASFSDDDLLVVSSQAASSQSFEHVDNDFTSSPPRPAAPRDDIIDLTSSPAVALTPGARTKGDISRASGSTAQPVFGRPTQMTPTAAVRRRDDILFNSNKNRPEHHRPTRITGPLAPKHPDRKAAPRPVFSSLGAPQPAGKDGAYPVSSYYSQPKANTATYGDVDFYTDPNKATEDLKALLEGGMEDDEDEDEAGENVDGKEAKAKKTAAEGLTEDGTLEGIKVKLLPHQVDGVRWMKGRELGPVKRGRVPKGGILADDMGLGKTLQAISLIIMNSRPEPGQPGWKKQYERVDKSTLVVAPLALIRQWEAEIKEKVTAEHALRVCVHHGPQRTARPRDLAAYDVVITTYQILVSEHNRSDETLHSGCFGVNWYRVILDEAHSIKNRNAKATKACCALSAEFRWCLTGTPMQNNLDELQSLVNFLRITPYSNLQEWRAHIDQPLKNGRGHLAIRRLHSLLRCFMKRRTKDILKEEGALVPGGKKALDAAAEAAKETKGGKGGKDAKAPPAPSFKITERNVVEVSAEFSPAERKFYDQLEERADESLEKMMKGKAMSYANALVLLLRLRQACNHPDLLKQELSADKDALSTDPAQKVAPGEDVDALADALGGLGIELKRCDVCLTELTADEQAASELGRGLLCTDCFSQDESQLERKHKEKEKKGKEKMKKEKVKKEKVKKEKVTEEEKENHKREGKEGKKDKKSKVNVKEEDDADDSVLVKSGRRQRNRRAVMDSDDEEEEADGSWLVGENERGSLRLGKAGGEEDENAEGGGDWIHSDDSAHASEDEDDGSRLSSFVVDDSQASKPEDEDDSDDSDDSDDTFASLTGAMASTKIESVSESESESEDEEEESSASDSDSDSDVSPIAARRRPSRPAGPPGVMMSAKIRKTLSILEAEAAEHKFIVFSQFTSMLDLVGPFLTRAGLHHVQYDGRMRNDAREASLQALRQDPRVRVLLCSLKCGALGLNLTAATRVVILEPFWNPFVEEQAIDRVHRLTQTVDVTVYKLTIADTVEQRILELQAKKRLLAAQALEESTNGGSRGKKSKKDALKLGLQELMDLFRHDTRGPATDADGSLLDASTLSATSATPPQPPSADNGLLRRREPASSKASSSHKLPQDSAYSRRW